MILHLMDDGGKFESSHIPLDQVLREIGEPFAIVTTEEKITTDIHGIIDYAVDGLSVIPTGFIAYKNHVVGERLDYFDLSAHNLLEDGKAVRNVAKNRVFIVANNDNPHNNPPIRLIKHIIAQQS